MEQAIEKLREEIDRIFAIDKLIADALCELEKAIPVKEITITQVKLKEARIWLDERQGQVSTEFAWRTCR